MKVSIIMCAYNVAEFIERAIESILTQSYQNWELIICNDASTDHTLALISKYLNDPRIVLIDQKKNVGYVKNKNFAFQHASGQLLTQLDADDTCPNDRIEKQVNAFIAYPEIKICGTNYQQIDLNDKSFHAKQYPNDFLISAIEDNYPFWFPGLMFKKELLEEFGYFSEYFIGIFGDDNYWTVRVNRKYPIYFIKDILYNYRVNPNSLTNVFDNPRKLIVSEIIIELIAQQKENNTDWIEMGEEKKMREFETALLTNKKLMAEKYRLWAAKAIDKNDLNMAKKLLHNAMELQGRNLDVIKTMVYYWRRKLFN